MSGFTKEHLGKPALRLARTTVADTRGQIAVYSIPMEDGIIEAISEDGEYVKFSTPGWFGKRVQWFPAQAIRVVETGPPPKP